jgi:hypothetical protein
MTGYDIYSIDGILKEHKSTLKKHKSALKEH